VREAQPDEGVHQHSRNVLRKIAVFNFRPAAHFEIIYINFTRVRRRAQLSLVCNSGTERVFYFAIYSSLSSYNQKRNLAKQGTKNLRSFTPTRYNFRPKRSYSEYASCLLAGRKLKYPEKSAEQCNLSKKGVGRRTRASAARRLGFSLLQ
jgi:hypothetical protein